MQPPMFREDRQRQRVRTVIRTDVHVSLKQYLDLSRSSPHRMRQSFFWQADQDFSCPLCPGASELPFPISVKLSWARWWTIVDRRY